MPERTIFISGNLHEFSFAPRHHNFLVNISKQFLLKIFVFHRSCTGANQMTSNTKNSLDSRRGCRARINFNSELRKQREPAAIDSPVLQWVNLIIANQLFDWLFSFFLWRCQYARYGHRLIGFQRTNRPKFIIQLPALIWVRDFPTDRTGAFPNELLTELFGIRAGFSESEKVRGSSGVDLYVLYKLDLANLPVFFC